MAEIMVGDEVLVRGTVLRVAPGVGVLVELFSKTDRYHSWIREDLVALVETGPLPDEPPDSTWLAGTRDGEEAVWFRHDATAPADADRRHQRHWWDIAAFERVDWPEAIRRGADPSRVLVEQEPGS